MVIKAAVLDGDNRMYEIRREIAGGEFVALEHATGGEGLVVLRLDQQRRCSRLDNKPAVIWNGCEAIEEISKG